MCNDDLIIDFIEDSTENIISKAIERLNGCKNEGIFRIPGSNAQLKIIKSKIDNGIKFDLGDYNDNYIIADLLKYAFYTLNSQTLATCYKKNEHLFQTLTPSVENIREVLYQLPQSRKNDYFKFIRLLNVVANTPETKMNIDALVLIIACKLLVSEIFLKHLIFFYEKIFKDMTLDM